MLIRFLVPHSVVIMFALATSIPVGAVTGCVDGNPYWNRSSSQVTQPKNASSPVSNSLASSIESFATVAHTNTMSTSTFDVCAPYIPYIVKPLAAMVTGWCLWKVVSNTLKARKKAVVIAPVAVAATTASTQLPRDQFNWSDFATQWKEPKEKTARERQLEQWIEDSARQEREWEERQRQEQEAREHREWEQGQRELWERQRELKEQAQQKQRERQKQRARTRLKQEQQQTSASTTSSSQISSSSSSTSSSSRQSDTNVSGFIPLMDNPLPDPSNSVAVSSSRPASEPRQEEDSFFSSWMKIVAKTEGLRGNLASHNANTNKKHRRY